MNSVPIPIHQSSSTEIMPTAIIPQSICMAASLPIGIFVMLEAITKFVNYDTTAAAVLGFAVFRLRATRGAAIMRGYDSGYFLTAVVHQDPAPCIQTDGKPTAGNQFRPHRVAPPHRFPLKNLWLYVRAMSISPRRVVFVHAPAPLACANVHLIGYRNLVHEYVLRFHRAVEGKRIHMKEVPVAVVSPDSMVALYALHSRYCLCPFICPREPASAPAARLRFPRRGVIVIRRTAATRRVRPAEHS